MRIRDIIMHYQRGIMANKDIIIFQEFSMNPFNDDQILILVDSNIYDKSKYLQDYLNKNESTLRKYMREYLKADKDYSVQMNIYKNLLFDKEKEKHKLLLDDITDKYIDAKEKLNKDVSPYYWKSYPADDGHVFTLEERNEGWDE